MFHSISFLRWNLTLVSFELRLLLDFERAHTKVEVLITRSQDRERNKKEIEAKLHGQDQSDSSRPPQKISSGKVKTKSLFENDTSGRNLKTI